MARTDSIITVRQAVAALRLGSATGSPAATASSPRGDGGRRLHLPTSAGAVIVPTATSRPCPSVADLVADGLLPVEAQPGGRTGHLGDRLGGVVRPDHEHLAGPVRRMSPCSPCPFHSTDFQNLAAVLAVEVHLFDAVVAGGECQHLFVGRPLLRPAGASVAVRVAVVGEARPVARSSGRTVRCSRRGRGRRTRGEQVLEFAGVVGAGRIVLGVASLNHRSRPVGELEHVGRTLLALVVSTAAQAHI